MQIVRALIRETLLEAERRPPLETFLRCGGPVP